MTELKRNGSSEFYALLDEMGKLHDKKLHDYASNSDPFGNYYFAGKLSKLFDNPDDSGFIGRLGEKLYRLANLENGNKVPANESIYDTETDICVIVTLWIASRRNRRYKDQNLKIDFTKKQQTEYNQARLGQAEQGISHQPQLYTCESCLTKFTSNGPIFHFIPGYKYLYFCSQSCKDAHLNRIKDK
jgi:hypothetical protein